MARDEKLKGGEAVQGPATNKYRPSNVAPPPEQEMRHTALGGKVTVQETSGVAAAEAVGKLQADPEEDPRKTAGSG
jgi:hypothetical protein